MEEHGKKEEWFLEFLHKAERLKCAPRHSWTSSGRRESVAEHSWRLGLAAWLLKEEFPQIDLERLLELCLLHDLGEAVTGDVPCFEKEAVHEREEERAVKRLAEILRKKKAGNSWRDFRNLKRERRLRGRSPGLWTRWKR